MKRIFISVLFIGLLLSNVGSQSLDEIIASQSRALKESAFDGVKTIKINGKLTQMGVLMTMTTYYKAPGMVRIVLSVGGQEIVQVFDGTKGYLINPMAGNTPQELTPDQVASMKNNSSFRSPLAAYHKEKKLTLEGTENINGKPAFKIKATDAGNTILYFVDKGTWLPVKMTVMSGGMNIDTFQEWAEIKGLMLPRVTRTVAGNVEININIEEVELNIPLDDSLFRV